MSDVIDLPPPMECRSLWQDGRNRLRRNRAARRVLAHASTR